MIEPAWTSASLEAHLASYELREPVTPDDCAAIRDDVLPRKALGVSLEVVIRGGTKLDRSPRRVEVVLGLATHRDVFVVPILA